MPIIKNLDIKKEKKKTPEEMKAQEEADTFIQRREQLKSRAQEAGQTKQQSGETAASIMRGEIQQKEATPQVTIAESLAKRAEVQTLQSQQQQELVKLEDLRNLEQNSGAITRLAQAGLVPLTQAANLIGKGLRKVGVNYTPQSAKTLGETSVGKIIGAPTGKALTTGIAGVNLGNIFYSTNRNNIKELQADASDLRAESVNILRTAISKGGDINESIKSTQIIEEAIRQKYADAEKSLKASPQDLADGMDLYDDMSRDLRVAVNNRQILERYALTGDAKEGLTAIGGMQSLIEEQNI